MCVCVCVCVCVVDILGCLGNEFPQVSTGFLKMEDVDRDLYQLHKINGVM